ncbi:hypothetical protein [Nonomuraea basaltis]|uniref:hypothetical protein n=1 Tax=Nonomuraea basaltis TaxID=2495887 RepID=UPI00148632F8|nr:hypothetical protein [Nonomuraea basaltis]
MTKRILSSVRRLAATAVVVTISAGLVNIAATPEHTDVSGGRTSVSVVAQMLQGL